MGKPKAPPPPNYAAAARATASGNLEAARAATAANRVDQFTPYGSLTYEDKGDDRWSATQRLSPEQQKIYEQNTALTQGLLGTAGEGLGSVNEMLADPRIDKSQLPSQPIAPGQSYIDAATQLNQPLWEREQQQLETRLANQGLTQGSEAYNNEMERLSRQRGIQQAQLTMGGLDRSQQAYQQALQNQEYERMMPLNIVNALRTGNQVQGPSFVNAPQQTTTAGADLLGAAQGQYQGQLAGYNAQQAGRQGMMGGLFDLGGAAIGAGLFSDRKLKRNIKRVGTHALGVGIYAFDYLWGEKGKGVMADELREVMPEAVVKHESGFDMVNYDMIGGAYAV